MPLRIGLPLAPRGVGAERFGFPSAVRGIPGVVILNRLNALQELQTRSAADLKKAYEAIDQVLDLRQQAQFRVFEEQMERRKLELVMRARQANRPKQQPPP